MAVSMTISHSFRVSMVLFVCAFALSCDSGPEGDGLVSVRYTVTSSDGGLSSVAFMDENNRREFSSTSGPTWTYEFRIEEFSQFLYLSTSNVRDGNVMAEIFVNDVLVAGHTNTDSLRYLRSSFAWDAGEGLITYSARGDRASRPRFLSPAGDNSFLESYVTRGTNVWSYLEISAIPNAPISLSMSRPQLASGSPCVTLSLGYVPEGYILGRVFYLDYVEQCTFDAIDLEVSAIIPGEISPD